VVKHGGLQAFGPVDGTKRNCFAVHLSNRNERRSTVAHFVSNVRNCVHVRRDLSVLRGLGELPLVERDVVRGTGASSEVALHLVGSDVHRLNVLPLEPARSAGKARGRAKWRQFR